jgi:hypothetical protein
MQGKDFDQFTQEMQELANCFPGREITAGLIERYYEALKPFSLPLVQRACMRVLKDTGREQYFPKAAELILQCRGLAHEEAEAERGVSSTHELYCLHRYEDQPKGADGEYPRCQARVPMPPPPGVTGTDAYYCPRHRTDYRGGARATDAEIDEVFSELLAADPANEFLQAVVAGRARRRMAGESVAQASMQAVLEAFKAKLYGTLPQMAGASQQEELSHDPDDVEAMAQRRRQQYQRAQAAGLPIREPGEDDA